MFMRHRDGETQILHATQNKNASNSFTIVVDTEIRILCTYRKVVESRLSFAGRGVPPRKPSLSL